METLHRTRSEPYTWQQPKRFKRFFTLEAGDARYATLHWEKPWSFMASASTTDGQWEFDHKGFLSITHPGSRWSIKSGTRYLSHQAVWWHVDLIG